MHTYHVTQKLPLGVKEAWDFFSSPANLQKITPDYLSFQITSRLPERMYPGLIISYKVRPLLGIPVEWVTEITHVNEPHFFVDEQRFGPYAFWHHKHFFTEIPGGILAEDTVHYKLPLGVFGKLANALFVKRQLAGIFEYRRNKLIELFGLFPG